RKVSVLTRGDLPGTPGIDGLRTEELRAYLKENWPRHRTELLEGTYEPKPVRRVEVPKPPDIFGGIGGGSPLKFFIYKRRADEQSRVQVAAPVQAPIQAAQASQATSVAGSLMKVPKLSGTSGRIQAVPFHPAYGYEDFIEGYRPQPADGQMGFILKDGIFKRLCKDARRQPERSFYPIEATDSASGYDVGWVSLAEEGFAQGDAFQKRRAGAIGPNRRAQDDDGVGGPGCLPVAVPLDVAVKDHHQDCTRNGGSR
ncbi:MAG: hypothetical protein M1602_05065, partial [Firmicutes bacterium]|nr:hypothetical protein [Bacillota bacterium]